MSEQNESRQGQRGVRIALRVIGGVLVVIGAVLAGTGFANFVSAFGGDGPPDKFWLCFVGLPLMVIGGWCLLAGFLGSISRYAADETAPLWVRFASILAPRQAPPIVPPPAGRGGFCSSCGAQSATGARFCASCGTPVG